jgi:hypothetical protein
VPALGLAFGDSWDLADDISIVPISAADRARDADVRLLPELAMRDISAEPLEPPDLPDRDAVRELGRVDEDLGLAAGLRVAVVRDAPAVRDVPAVREVPGRDFPAVRDAPAGRRAAVVRRAGVAAVGFADDIVFAAAVRAFAAVVMALVAVFIARMADDIVLADAVALVAAAVILLAADVTLVAAEDTVLAATAGVAEPRLAVLRLAVLRLAVPRLAVLRPAVLRRVVLRVPVPRVAELRLVVPLRAAVVREPVERDAVDRDAELRVVREVVPRVELALAAGFAAVLRVVRDDVLDDLEPEVDGRLAVPLDALRLTDLLRAVLAEPRRVAARVLD